MGGKALLVFVAGLIGISGAIFLSITKSSADIAANADKNYLRQVSLNIAHSGVNMGLRQLAVTPSWRAGIAMKQLFGGKVAVSARDTVYNSAPVVKITAISVVNEGQSSERRDTSIAFVSPVGGGFLPPGVMGAITSNHLVYPQGGALIDGRDHDTSGAFVPIASGGKGTFGYWTLGNFTGGGASKVGGTFGGVDYTPTASPGATVGRANQTWPNGGTFPNTPDLVMGGSSNGFPDGKMKTIAQSGVLGSQYVTNPKNLKHPLQGVTYIDLPPSGATGGIDISGTGFLIVHNASGTAILDNPTTKSGSFKGLVMADEIVHTQGTIMGAVVDMGGKEDDIANGNGQILYSSQVLKWVTGALGQTMSGGPSVKGSSANVIAWWE